MKSELEAQYVAALEHELEGYVAAGREDRAEMVRAELARVQGLPAGDRPARKQASGRLRGAGKETRSEGGE